MALRFSSILIVFILIATCSFGQSKFLKRIPPYQPTLIHIAADTVAIAPTVKNEFRPELNILSYALPDNSLLTGFGLSFQHLKWDAPTKKWKSQWSGNLLIWNKTSLDGKPGRAAIGLAFGIMNNLILIGAANDFKTTFATVGIGINLNN